MQFDRGYLSPYFITNAEKMVVEFEDAYVLITDKKISSIQQMLPILEAVARSGKSLLIIAEDVDGEALSTLVVNRLRGVMKVAAVKAPGFGDRRKDMLADIAIITQAKNVISDELGIQMEKVTLDDLGVAKNVRITKDNTTIVGVNDSGSDEIQSRVKQIQAQIEASDSDYDKEKLRERLAKLSGGVAVLKVGGGTEVEVKERRDRVEDALNATRAAIAEGVVPGGGVALLYASKALDSLKGKNEDEQIGINIVKRALSGPVFRIAENAGSEGACVVDHLLKQNDEEMIFNVETMNYANAFTSGVIDPAKVVRIAFEMAISVLSVFVTTESMIVDIPEEKSDSSAPGGYSGMGDMGGMGGF